MDATSSTPSSNVRTESAAEFVATVRKDHQVMMEWYNSTHHHNNVSALHDKYGATYPESWKNVLNWNGWKETRAAYLQYLQQGSEPSTTGSSTTTQNSSGTNGTQATTTTTEPLAIKEEPPSQSTEPSSEAAKPKRKSRWGNATSAAATTTPTTVSTDGTTDSLDTSNGKRGRWGTTTPTAATPAVMTTSALHPSNGTSGGTELEQLQAKLRALNYKIDHAVEEATRIDALPHDDRERSVSPPPSYVYTTSSPSLFSEYFILTHIRLPSHFYFKTQFTDLMGNVKIHVPYGTRKSLPRNDKIYWKRF
jgi:hypothetical protein